MAIITYDGDEFKSIDCIPEYADYPMIYVAKTPHVDESGRSYQAINRNWRNQEITHPVYDYANNKGYHRVNLPRINGNKGGAFVHRLVFLTWQAKLPVNYRELEINHLDETRDNNRFANLEMITHRDNLNYGSHNQRMHATLVKKGRTTRVIAIDKISRRTSQFDSISECARRLGVSTGNVGECIAGRRHSRKGYVFCREEDYSPAKVDELIAAATRRKTKN